ncbi:hypothetical protein ACFVFS_23270 [Kitasatospora sp. NPDC057692]|uniref:hypothetical protein n=1 Tax=Kitasatospora sp. NPDC057692 TaxID=3346215 RepID=UPI00367467DA
MSGPDNFEDDLLYALTRTGEGFRPGGPSELAAGGLARGRRRWRRRSATAVVGGAAALALVGTGTVYLAGGAPAGTTVTAAAGSGTGSGSAAPTAAAAPSTPAAQAAPVSADEVLATFKALLPKGEVTAASGRGTDPDGKPAAFAMPGAVLVLDDGKGKAQLGLSIARLGEGDPRRTENECPDKKYVPYDACTTTTLPDGGTLTVFQGYEYPDRRADTKRWYAKLTGKDGRLIELNEWNSPAEKGQPVSRPAPPLTPEQLTAVVTDKSWDRVVAAVPQPGPVTPRETAKEYSREEILAIVAKLLPAGLTETETGGQPGFANFVVNDGKGKSLVEINVQDWRGPNKDTSLYGSAEKRADGTKVVVRKSTGKPVMWTVDTLHPDGLRVVISAFNSGTQNSPATRTAPALTVEQLTAIALSPEWKLRK